MKVFVLLLSLFSGATLASGPVAPHGWEGSFARALSNGASCCLAADLNGTGLAGGAFVFISTDKTEFGLFALTYTASHKEHWQLLEKHPASMLRSFRFSVVPPGKYPQGAIKACAGRCRYYFSPGSGLPLRRANKSFKPNPLRGSA
jgi:hypothetical protein